MKHAPRDSVELGYLTDKQFAMWCRRRLQEHAEQLVGTSLGIKGKVKLDPMQVFRPKRIQPRPDEIGYT